MWNRTAQVRLGLLGVASFLIVLINIQPGHSQGISGRPPIGPPTGISGIGGRPPGFPGSPPGFPGMPGNISGRPGSITGISGIPDPPGFGLRGFPEPPPIGIGGMGITGISGIGGTGINGIGGGPRFVTVWSCSRCRTELGRGDFRPNVPRCPTCGVEFINGGGGIGSALIPPPTTPMIPPGMVTPPPVNVGVMGGLPVGIVPPNEFNPPMMPPPMTNPTVTGNVPTATTDTKSGSKTATIIGIALGGLLLLGIGVMVLVMAWPKAEKPKRRRIRRYDDDD